MDFQLPHIKRPVLVFSFVSALVHALPFLFSSNTSVALNWRPGTEPIHTVMVSGTRFNGDQSEQEHKAKHVTKGIAGARQRPASNQESDNGRRHVVGIIQSKLSHLLTYPPMARKQGWEGTVVLWITIQADGKLSQIQLRKSSGYRVLDKSAIDALNAMGQVPELATILNGRNIETRLPVKYRIVG